MHASLRPKLSVPPSLPAEMHPLAARPRRLRSFDARTATSRWPSAH